eukprot:243736_1
MAAINLIEESVKAAIADVMDEKGQAMDQAEMKAIWKSYLAKDAFGQVDTFLNVCWGKLSDQKDDIVKIYIQYQDRADRVKPQKVGFGPFNLILENLTKDKVTAVVEATTAYTDRPSMAKRFGELGFKLNNNYVSLLEALLFVYGLNKAGFVGAAPTPASAVLRQKTNELKAVQKAHQDRADEIAKLKDDLENGRIKKMKTANEQLRLKNLEESYRADGVKMKRELKAAQKGVEVAEKGLGDENAAGTEASNYLKGAVEEIGKQSASSKWKK